MDDTENSTPDEIHNRALGLKRNGQIVEAVKLFKIATEKGYINSMNFLGDIYAEGYDDLPQDLNESMKYYQMSADADDTYGMSSLTSLIVDSKVPLDPNIHLKYYDKLLEKGEFNTAFQYIKMFYNGNNYVKKNKPKAAELLKKAADNGINIACYLYAKMLYQGDGISVCKGRAAHYLEKMTKLQILSQIWLTSIWINAIQW